MPVKNDRRVTVIGLGAMGKALAGAFLAAGNPTTVWNRSAGKADELVAKGATLAHTVADAVAASPLVVVCVLDYQVAQEVLDASDGTAAGRVLVNLTNGTPEQAREMARQAARRGVDYLDGGIMAIPPGIATSQSFLLYSGSQAAFTTHQNQLEILGASHYLGADAGLAALFDLALLSGMYGMFAGVLHAFALVGTENVAATEFISLLGPWLHAMTASLPRFAQHVDTGDYTTGVVSNLDMQAAGFPNLIQASQAQGIRTELMLPIKALIEARVADGHGAENLAGVIELIKNPTGTEELS